MRRWTGPLHEDKPFTGGQLSSNVLHLTGVYYTLCLTQSRYLRVSPVPSSLSIPAGLVWLVRSWIVDSFQSLNLPGTLGVIDLRWVLISMSFMGRFAGWALPVYEIWYFKNCQLYIEEFLSLNAEWMQRFFNHIFAHYDSLLPKGLDEIIERLQMLLNNPQCRHKEGQKFPNFWWDNHPGKSSHMFNVGEQMGGRLKFLIFL